MKRKVAIIGAGLQAGRRAPPIAEGASHEIALVVDRKPDKAERLARRFGAEASADWRTALRPDVESVLVLTYPDSHAEIATACLQAGKHVLCEKPLAHSLEQAAGLVEAARASGRVLKCGFNHRHHPAILAAHRLFVEGRIGKPVFGRARYGIGGRAGIESEWRSDP